MAREPLKESFRLQEVWQILRSEYFKLQKERDELTNQKFALSKKLLSPSRATEIAKNIFVHGEFKKLREDMRKFEKKKKLLFPLQIDNQQKELADRKNHLEKLCSSPKAKEKIWGITAGILLKNQNIAKKISRLNSKIKNIDSQMQHIYNQLLCVQKTIPKIKLGNHFKVKGSFRGMI